MYEKRANKARKDLTFPGGFGIMDLNNERRPQITSNKIESI